MAGKLGAKIYRSKDWQIIRREIFKRDSWRCVSCGRAGRLECDHIQEITKAKDWFDEKNLQSLCRSCHIAKSRKERKMRNAKTDKRKQFQELLEGMLHAQI